MNTQEKLNLILAELRAIKERLPPADPAQAEQFCSVKQAAVLLRLSEARIYELVYSHKLIPVQHKKNHRILFSFPTIQQYLHENLQKQWPHAHTKVSPKKTDELLPPRPE